jgi:hypothetical protein
LSTLIKRKKNRKRRGKKKKKNRDIFPEKKKKFEIRIIEQAFLPSFIFCPFPLCLSPLSSLASQKEQPRREICRKGGEISETPNLIFINPSRCLLLASAVKWTS